MRPGRPGAHRARWPGGNRRRRVLATCNAQRDADHFTIHCDYGQVSGSRELGVYRSLPEANMALYTGSGPAFTVSPDTGRVVLADHRLIGEIEPVALRTLLNQMSAQAKAWRIDYSLTKSAGKRDAPPAPVPGQPRTGHSMARRLLSMNQAGQPRA